MTHSTSTAAVLLHDQMLEMEGYSTALAKSPYFSFSQKVDFDTSTGSQNLTSMDFK